jgi:hypothetical protein
VGIKEEMESAWLATLTVFLSATQRMIDIKTLAFISDLQNGRRTSTGIRVKGNGITLTMLHLCKYHRSYGSLFTSMLEEDSGEFTTIGAIKHA